MNTGIEIVLIGFLEEKKNQNSPRISRLYYLCRDNYFQAKKYSPVIIDL